MRRPTPIRNPTRGLVRAGRRSLPLLAAFALLGCGADSDDGDPPMGPGPTVQSVTVTPGTQTLSVGATGQLTAAVVRSDGPVLSPTVSWVS